MDQQLHQSAAYDYRPYDRLWQRVAPGLEPYPADTRRSRQCRPPRRQSCLLTRRKKRVPRDSFRRCSGSLLHGFGCGGYAGRADGIY